MRFNLISNLANGVGLQHDYEILRQALESRGHRVEGVQFDVKGSVPAADVNIFLEVVTSHAFHAAPRQWVIPNPEWWFADWERCPWDKVLAKTRDCERIFTAKVGSRCQYLGWMSRDLYQEGTAKQRQRTFLHVAGKSQFKNTHAVVAGCQLANVPVTVVGEYIGAESRRLSDAVVTTLMNTHFCHVMPSAYEGYGHVLHEAMAVGQVIITTDAPPMNEVRPAVLIPWADHKPHHAGTLYRVTPEAVAAAVRQVLAMPSSEVHTYRQGVRAQYLADVQQFHDNLTALVGVA